MRSEPDANRAFEEVASENRRAARLGPSPADLDSGDRTWRLAVATTMELQGGPAAVITPEARKRIRKLATTIGARPFEAELVMAVVRDAAANGDSPMSREVQRRLSLASGAGHRLDGTRRTVEHEAKKTTAAQHIVLAGCTAVLLAGWLLWIAIAWVRAN